MRIFILFLLALPFVLISCSYSWVPNKYDEAKILRLKNRPMIRISNKLLVYPITVIVGNKLFKNIPPGASTSYQQVYVGDVPVIVMTVDKGKVRPLLIATTGLLVGGSPLYYKKKYTLEVRKREKGIKVYLIEELPIEEEIW